MNEFVALHTLRDRISAALRSSPGYQEWLASGASASDVTVACGLEELALFEVLSATGYVRPDGTRKAASFLGYNLTKSGAVSGVSVSFKL